MVCHTHVSQIEFAFSDLLVPVRKPPKYTELHTFHCCDEHVTLKKQQCLWQLVMTQKGLDASLVKIEEYIRAGNALLDELYAPSPGAHELCNSSEHIVPFSVMDSFLSPGHSVLESCFVFVQHCCLGWASDHFLWAPACAALVFLFGVPNNDEGSWQNDSWASPQWCIHQAMDISCRGYWPHVWSRHPAQAFANRRVRTHTVLNLGGW